MKFILHLLIIFWIFIAGINVVYNARKTISEIKEWSFLSDSQKRHKIFGDLYDFIIVVDKHTENNATIILFSTSDVTNLLSRYYLFPKRIIVINNKNKLISLANVGKYKYIASYNNSLKLDTYIPIASYSSEISKNSGFLYQKK